MERTAVSGFHDDIVRLREGSGRAENIITVAANVAAESYLYRFAVLFNAQVHGSAANDMAGVCEHGIHFITYSEPFLVSHRLQVIQGAFGVFYRIEWLDIKQVFLCTSLVGDLHIIFLDLCRVHL